MNSRNLAKHLLRLATVLALLLVQCAGGFKSDTPNAPQFEDSVFGSDSGG